MHHLIVWKILNAGDIRSKHKEITLQTTQNIYEVESCRIRVNYNDSSENNTICPQTINLSHLYSNAKKKTKNIANNFTHDVKSCDRAQK